MWEVTNEPAFQLIPLAWGFVWGSVGGVEERARPFVTTSGFKGLKIKIRGPRQRGQIR